MSDYTPEQWRAHRNISKASHYKLRRLGRAPEELVLPGTRIIRITEAADQAWEQRMRELAQGKAAQQEAQRRQQWASVKGKLAAQSELHVSKHRAKRA